MQRRASPASRDRRPARYWWRLGPEVFAEDRGLLERLADTAARAYEGEQLVAEAARSAQLEEVDRLRPALLAAVGHDLRTPLAGVKAAVSSLRARRRRLESGGAGRAAGHHRGVGRPSRRPDQQPAGDEPDSGRCGRRRRCSRSRVDEVVARAVLHTARGSSTRVHGRRRRRSPSSLADAGLLERVVANLVDNAQRFTPTVRLVEVSARLEGDAHSSPSRSSTTALVSTPAEWEQMFTPFQHSDGSPGVGLGLAIARGFTEAMHGTFTRRMTAWWWAHHDRPMPVR